MRRGCARYWGGDDRKAKHDVKTVDWTRPTLDGLKMAWENALPGANAVRKALRLADLSLHQKRNNAEMIALRCERGANIVRKIGMTEQCADAIHSLDEHWNGSGYPERLRGKDAPVLARILGVAQHLDIFAGEQGRERAIATLLERSGSWFDPELVRIAVALDRSEMLWTWCGTDQERDRVLEMEPVRVRLIDAEQLDRVCEAFADVVDAKSSFTYRHSIGVMEAAGGIARQLGLTPARHQLIYRAALLHDLGKLRVPNSILDKQGKLDDAEWAIIREHPLLSQQILERIPSFSAIATIAGRHHERLDGSGYPYNLKSDQLSLEDRIVAVADIYGALAEDRPYRAGLSAEQILSILSKEVPHKLDPECFEALQAFMEHHDRSTSIAFTPLVCEKPEYV